jgi:hypothetical protein
MLLRLIFMGVGQAKQAIPQLFASANIQWCTCYRARRCIQWRQVQHGGLVPNRLQRNLLNWSLGPRDHQHKKYPNHHQQLGHQSQTDRHQWDNAVNHRQLPGGAVFGQALCPRDSSQRLHVTCSVSEGRQQRATDTPVSRGVMRLVMDC